MASRADLYAQAIIAAARTYGDDPIKAFSAKGGKPRRCLTAAAHGLHAALGVSKRSANILFGLGPNAIKIAQRRGDSHFAAAEAAENAIRAALSAPRPSTRDKLAEAVRKRSQTIREPRSAPPGRHSVIHAPVRFQGHPEPPQISLGGRIMTELSNRPLSGASLATILGEKENIVCQALAVLRHEGLIVCDDPPPAGERFKCWRIVREAA